MYYKSIIYIKEQTKIICDKNPKIDILAVLLLHSHQDDNFFYYRYLVYKKVMLFLLSMWLLIYTRTMT